MTSRLHIVDRDTMLRRGLELINWDPARLHRISLKTQKRKFRETYGNDTSTLCDIYEDLQTTSSEEARIVGSESTLTKFLIAVHCARNYQAEHEALTVFTCIQTEKTYRKYVWPLLSKIAALKEQTVRNSLFCVDICISLLISCFYL